METRNDKLRRLSDIGFTLPLAFLAALLLIYPLVYLTYLIHELGHATAAVISALIAGRFILPEIGGWQQIPLLGLWTPTVTRSFTGNFLIAFSGPLVVFIIGAYILSRIYEKNRKLRNYVLVALVFPVVHLLANVLCGTDNWAGEPLVACGGWLQIEGWSFLAVVPLATKMFYDRIEARCWTIYRRFVEWGRR